MVPSNNFQSFLTLDQSISMPTNDTLFFSKKTIVTILHKFAVHADSASRFSPALEIIISLRYTSILWLGKTSSVKQRTCCFRQTNPPASLVTPFINSCRCLRHNHQISMANIGASELSMNAADWKPLLFFFASYPSSWGTAKAATAPDQSKAKPILDIRVSSFSNVQ